MQKATENLTAKDAEKQNNLTLRRKGAKAETAAEKLTAKVSGYYQNHIDSYRLLSTLIDSNRFLSKLRKAEAD